MPDDRNGPGFPGPSVPPNAGPPPGVWVPSVAPPPSPPPARRRSRSGCGTSAAALLVFIVVIALVIGGAVAFTRWRQSNDPEHLRTERIEQLHGVCEGQGIADVPAYRRGADGQLGARVDLDDDEDDEEERNIVAFPLVPGAAADPKDIVDARLMACTTSTPTQTETCRFNDRTQVPNLGGGGNITATWTTRTSTEVRIVDVHSGKVLHKATFETPNGCPSMLRVDPDGGYQQSLPLDQIASQTEAQVALFHQG